MMNTEDKVIKRNGQKENISFDKILNRVKKLGGDELSVNYTHLVQKIIYVPLPMNTLLCRLGTAF